MVNLVNFIDAFILGGVLAITAVSAVMALEQAYRRDHAGLIHDTAPKALITLAIGAICAAMLTANDSAARPIRITDALTEAWEWIAAIVAVTWLYALVAALVTTVIYFRQQRRLHAAAGPQDS